MCVETTQSFTTCYCTVVRHNICTKHIEHTHQQLDNEPCPNFVQRYVQTPSTTSQRGTLGCTSTTHCPREKKKLYHFQTWALNKERLAAFAEFHVRTDASCWDGQGHPNWRHTCEMGGAWEGSGHMIWKHLNGPDDQSGKSPAEIHAKANAPKIMVNEVEVQDDDAEMDD
ncbi:hypothetical protein EG329_012227 [Mollisiaceae sp. DMI_Dod_QoI]|nr:hypothetical protein EG329_012227 [Helotiales sp. DMI_Dod_QoI]